MKLTTLLFTTLLLALAPPGAWAQEPATDAAATSTAAAPVSAETWSSFEALFGVIQQSRQDLAALRTQLGKARDEAEREKLRNDIALLESNIESLQLAWELWATGGVDLELFLPRKEEKFDWRQEIQSVFEPIVVELQRLTERPRKIERLRTELAFFQQQLEAAAAALRNIDDYKRLAPTPALQSAFNDLEANWRKRHDGIQSRVAVINLQLEELRSTEGLVDEKTGAALKSLLTGRLANLLLAVLAAALTYGVLRSISRFYARLSARRGRRPFAARAVHLAFMLLSVILALLAAIAVLYLRGDRILLGLLFIALIGVALTLQRTLPGYFKEAKVLLNMGSVREGQRVIYNGLPWKVASLNVYSVLVNPALRGGRLLLPLKELTGLISRPFDDAEPWFPTQENDHVLLADGSFGRVLLQTPELVQLQVFDAVCSYPVGAFLDAHPQNLSQQGFAITLSFGLDYRHQALATGEIQRQLAEHLRAQLTQSAFGAQLKELTVEFEEAAASSLNFLIYASFTGAAAESYYRIRRLLQALAVDACNAHGWVIPFRQMTVHLSKQNIVS